MIDQPKTIRKGEELNIEALKKYLTNLDQSWDGSYEVRQFPAGFSNLTYWLKVDDREYVLRKPPHGANIKGGHDMLREYRVLKALKPSFSKVPQVHLYCEDDSIIGGTFYIMERVEGVILRGKGIAASVEEKQVIYTQASEALLDTFVELHQVDYQAAGLGDLGKPEGYVERQIKGWSKRYFKAKTDELSAIENVIQWLNDNIYPEKGYALIHNDFKYDNLVYEPNNWKQIIAVLDWEMATLGDPIMDLGTTLAYWIGPDDPPSVRLMTGLPTFEPGNPTRSQLLDQYAQKTGYEIGNFSFYYAYGLFKLAVIVQQIYARYKLGYTKDPRFANLNIQTKQLGEMAWQSIQKNRVDNLF